MEKTTTNAELLPANIRAERKDEVIEIDLLELFRVYMSNLKYILAAMVAGAVIMACVSMFLIEPTYMSTAKMYVVSSSTSAYVNLSDVTLGESLASDYAALIQGEPVLQKTIDNLDLDMTTGQLLGMITITNPSDTRILEISAVSEDPRLSSEIANEIMNVAIEYLPETMDTVSPNVAEEASKYGSQVGPSYVKNTEIGALLGILLVLAILTFRYISDDTVKNEEEMERLFGLKVLAAIPEDDRINKG